MKKKIISLALAVTLICSLAVTVSAAQHTYMGSYGSAFYEVVDNLYLDQFSSSTMCTEPYMVYSNVLVTLDTAKTVWYWGTPKAAASSTYGGTADGITSIKCDHYVDGYFVHTNTMRNNF